MTKTIALLFALAVGVAHARNEEFMEDFGGGGLSMGAIQILMIGFGLWVGAVALFARSPRGSSWRSRVLVCVIPLAFVALAWWVPELAMILSVVFFAVVMMLV